MKILYLVDELNYVSGVSKHLYYLLREISKDNKVYIICPGGSFVEEFKEYAEVVVYPGISFSNRTHLSFLISILYLIYFTTKNHIKIIHSHTHYTANIAHYSSLFTKVKTIQTIHGIIPEGGRLPHFRAQKYITVSKKSLEYLISIGIDKNRIFIIYCGLPIPGQFQKPADKLIILCASRLIPEKGVDIFIEALNLIDQYIPQNVEVLIAGSGEIEEKVVDMISKTKVNINYLGIVNDLYSILNKSHIFVFPSWSKSEGFPGTLVEAAINQNLIISTDFVSLREIFSEREVIICKERDAKDLSEKILYGINNYTSLKSMVEKNYNHTVSIFGLETMRMKMNNIYSDLRIGS